MDVGAKHGPPSTSGNSNDTSSGFMLSLRPPIEIVFCFGDLRGAQQAEPRPLQNGCGQERVGGVNY